MTALALPATGTARLRPAWALAAAVVALEVAYPLVHGHGRDVLTVVTVVTFAAASVVCAALTRGPSYAARLVAVAGGGGFLAEAVGVHTGVPFGSYAYAGSLGARVAGVPLVIPLAWVMFAHPSAVVAGIVARSRPARVVVAAWALASWDVFLDPQMVAAGHWTWAHPSPHLPGIGDVPLSNDAGWLAVALVLMALLVPATGDRRDGDEPAIALWLWTFLSSVLANVAFFGRPAVAGWGALAMGVVAVPLVRRLRAT